MIFQTGQVETADGNEVVIYTTNSGNPSYPIHGAVRSPAGVLVKSWTADGFILSNTNGVRKGYDLVHKKSKFFLETVLYIYRDTRDGKILYGSYESAPHCCTLARKVITLEGIEGDGL